MLIMVASLIDFNKSNTKSRPEAHLKASQTSKTELFEKIING